MPATSEKQKRFMDAVAHNPGFAKKVGVPQSVAKEFSGKSKGMSFGKGDRTRVDRQGINKPKTDHGDSSLFKKGGEMKESKAMVKKEVSFMKKKGAPASMVKHEAAEMGAMKKGGMPMVMKDGKKVPAFAVKKMAYGGIATSKMGSVKTAAPSVDGVAAKGKTKGTQIKMSGSKPLGMKMGGKA
jgi:hypothetical protein